MKDWDYEAQNHIRLMTDFLGSCISVEEYRSQFSNMNAKWHMLSDEQDVVIQKAYGDADDYDEVVSLPYTIDLPTLRGRVANSVRALHALEHGDTNTSEG